MTEVMDRPSSELGRFRRKRTPARPIRVAMLGTRGVPARYGGFEIAVEEVGRRLAGRGHEVVVYCRNDGQTLDEHLGMTLVNLPALRLKHTETLSHTALSVAHLVAKPC